MLGGHHHEARMTTSGARSPLPTPVRTVSARRWSREPRHRRRRLLALVAGVTLAIVLAIVMSGGGTHRTAVPGQGQAGFFRSIETLAGSGAHSLSAQEHAVQTAAIDRTLQYTPYVRIAGAQHREVALTFDDGPGPFTPEIVTILNREDVPGTFFEVGLEERFFHAGTSQVVASGFPIGDHTFSHKPMSALRPAAQRAQLLDQIRATKAYGVPFPRLFRPPDGLWNSTTLSLLHQYRMLMVLWSVDTNDYRRPGAPAIVSAAVHGAQPGAIILLHDAGGDRSETVLALPKIIAALRERGYRFATVPQLLADNPAPADQQISGLVGSG
jgi:peptidoglycan/xylan/chitin deacetylase (PgdA/CDA1 family)